MLAAAVLLSMGCASKKVVRILSSPEGATVFLNGQQAGITPLTRQLVFDSRQAGFELTVRKEGFEDGKGRIEYYPVAKTDYLVELPKIVSVPIELLTVEPQLTERGMKLAFERKPTIAYLEVIERSPNVAAVTRLTDNEDKAIQIGPPVLSPSEDILVYTEFIEEQKGLYSNIQKKRIGSTAKTRLTYGKYRDLFPVFTPDGKQVVFSSNRASAEDSQIWKVPVNAALLTQLREGDSPQVSPDGTKILFSRRDKLSKAKQLWLMSMEGPGRPSSPRTRTTTPPMRGGRPTAGGSYTRPTKASTPSSSGISTSG